MGENTKLSQLVRSNGNDPITFRIDATIVGNTQLCRKSAGPRKYVNHTI